MKSVRPTAAAVFLVGLLTSSLFAPAYAQSSLDDVQKAVAQKAAELEKVDALLANPDKNIRISAVQALLESGNPVFMQRAREAALYSSDPAMRLAILKDILDKGGTFKLVLNLKGLKDEETRAKDWLSNVGGTWNTDVTTGEFTFNTNTYDPKYHCWPFLQSSACAFSLSGENVALSGWHAASGNLKLGTDGKLKGFLQTRLTPKGGSPIPAEIDLSE